MDCPGNMISCESRQPVPDADSKGAGDSDVRFIRNYGERIFGTALRHSSDSGPSWRADSGGIATVLLENLFGMKDNTFLGY